MSANSIDKPEYKQLIYIFNNLPPIKLVESRHDLTKEQNWRWEQERIKWKIIGSKIDYLQRMEAGFIVKDPLADPIFDSAWRVYFNILTDRLFAELNLTIAGWEPIQDAANSNQRDFPFNNPRELFAESCKQESEFGTEFFLSTDINQGETLADIRDYYRFMNSFYRDRLEHQKQSRMLQAHQECDRWQRFVIYAVWNYRRDKNFNKGKISMAWRNFLKAFKAESAMICNKSFMKKYGVKFCTLKWNQGHPVYTNTNRPVLFPTA